MAPLCKRRNKCKSGDRGSGSNSRLKTPSRHSTTLLSVEVDERTSEKRDGAERGRADLNELRNRLRFRKRVLLISVFSDGVERKIYEASNAKYIHYRFMRS